MSEALRGTMRKRPAHKTQEAGQRAPTQETPRSRETRNAKRQVGQIYVFSPPSAKAPRAKSQGLSAKKPPRAKSQERTRREEREARAISTGTYIAVSSRLSTQVNQPGSPSSRAKSGRTRSSSSSPFCVFRLKLKRCASPRSLLVAEYPLQRIERLPFLL